MSTVTVADDTRTAAATPRPSAWTYTKLEALRTLRNRRFVIFSFAFPLVLFLITAGPQRGDRSLGGSGIPAVLYFMCGMAAWGGMTAMISTGARIAIERQSGWQRQLRITPLGPGRYLATKVLVSYAMALVSVLLIYAAGIAYGASVGAGRLVEMVALVLIGLLPFGALGVLVGHLAKADSIGPIMGGGVALLAFVSGTWFPLDQGSVLYEIGRELPSYWLVQAGHVGMGAGAWPAHAWIVVAAWTAGLGVLAMRAYRRDTGRS